MGEDRISRRKFIGLGTALGVSVVGGAATGGAIASAQETTQETTQASAVSSTTDPTVEPGGIIVAEAFIPPGLAFAFNVAGDGGSSEPALLVHMQDGSWVAYSTVCTHKGCEVGYELETGNLGCPCHGSVFNPAEGGAVVQGPAQNPLREIEVRVEDGNVVLA